MVDPEKAPILAAVAAVASEDAPAPEPPPKPARKPAEESTPKLIAKTEFTTRVQSLVDKLAGSNPAFNDLQSRVNTILGDNAYREFDMTKFMNDLGVPSELQSVMENVLVQMGVDAKTLYTMEDDTYISLKGTSMYVQFTIYLVKMNNTFTLTKTLPDSLTSVQVITSITKDPPAGSKVVSENLMKLFEFIYKQLPQSGKSRHTIPHRPAKKTRRHRRR